VLSACASGRSSTAVPVERLGLAQAFLLAGSRAVIASTRLVKDSDLPAFFPPFYREWDREPEDLAEALQRAQLSWRRRDPRADWESFRLFEP
jgi:CHAT domain-containing protein